MYLELNFSFPYNTTCAQSLSSVPKNCDNAFLVLILQKICFIYKFLINFDIQLYKLYKEFRYLQFKAEALHWRKVTKGGSFTVTLNGLKTKKVYLLIRPI